MRKSHKPFCQKSYNDNDTKTKKAVVNFFASKGIKCEIPVENYGYDVLVYNNDEITKVEGEHKIDSWTTQKWPKYFKTIDVPDRRRNSKAELYMLFNREYNSVAITEMKNVLRSMTYVKSTTHTKNETFFGVDPKLFTFHFLKNNEWIKQEK